MRRSGFTTIEMLIVVAMIGLLAAIGFPRIRRALNKTNVRSARVFLGTAVVTGRAAAVGRGCPAVVHFSSGAGAQVWVTACPRRNPGPGTVDTLGSVVQLGSRYNVTLTPTRDSIQFDPRGLSMDNANTTVRIQGNVGAEKDSVFINTLGRVVR